MAADRFTKNDAFIGTKLSAADGRAAFVQAVQQVASDGTALGDATGAFVVMKPATTGGLSLSRVVTGVGGVIKAAAGQMYTLTAYNANAAVRYLHLYNKATAPTLLTDTPVMTIPLLGASVRDINLSDLGIAFATGIAWSYTTDDIAIPATAGTSTELHFTAAYK